MNWLLLQSDFRISIFLINDIWIVLSIKILWSVFFSSGIFSFSASLFHKLLFQGIKFSVFDTSVNKNLYKFGIVSLKIEIKTFLNIYHSEFKPRLTFSQKDLKNLTVKIVRFSVKINTNFFILSCRNDNSTFFLSYHF